MKTSINLYIEKSVTDKARRKAKKSGSSLSRVIEKYLEDYTGENELKVSDYVKGIGIKQSDEKFDYKKELGGLLADKYLKGR